MANGNRQYDPVAAATTSALDATQRSIRSVRSQLNAPQLPAESQAFQGARSVVTSVAQFSPANVLARGQLPSPSGQGGQFAGLPSPQQLFPGQGQLSGFPTADQMMPGNNNSRRDGNASDGSGGGGSRGEPRR